MKKILVVIVSILIFLGCDKVKNPIQNPNAVTGCTVTPHVVKTNSLTMNCKKVIVEDYTGHTCGNCPRAAEDAETIMNLYKDSVIVIAVHAGTTFAPPFPPDYPDDFRTSVGTDWDGFLGMSAAGLPKGGVNRAQTPYAQPRTTWSSYVNTLLDGPQQAKMLLTTTLDTAKMLLNVSVKTTFLSALNYNVNLCVVITEDSIVGSQKDYSPPPTALVINGDERPDYRFNHMLRGAVNGSWGELVKSSPVANDTITKNYSCFTLNPWPVAAGNPKKNLMNTSVVAFLFNATTKEIIQAEKVKIK